MTRASLAMYDMLAPVQAANDHFWSAVRTLLVRAGIDAPEKLDREISYNGIWLKPDLLLAQTCGYPYLHALRGKVQIVGTPIYRFAGRRGTDRCSFIVVREDEQADTLGAMKGRRAALNDHLSNSGMNLFRAAVAPLAGGKPFFSEIMEMGEHTASMKAVLEGKADIASIDSVSWGLIESHYPERLSGFRILAETPYGPGLPFITRLDLPSEQLATLRQALVQVITDPANRDTLDVLGIIDIAMLGDEDYLALDRLRLEAERLGYPELR
jgi:ABC-type phosphate/phosphonate transport system substrate-binding protein